MGLWRKRREEFWRRLEEDLEIGYLDTELLDILRLFFKLEGVFSMSSCSGRITVIDGELPWVRKGSTIVFKKHSPISEEDLLPILKQPTYRRLWLVVTGPIIHLSAASLKDARRVLRLAREVGMKHSGILSMSKRGIVVELRTGIRLTQLLKVGDKLIVSKSDLSEVISVANEVLMKGKEVLKRLREALSRAVQGG